MRIRAKLVGLALGTQCLLLAAALVWWIATWPSAAYARERESFRLAAERAQTLRIEANRLASMTVGAQTPVFEAAVAAMEGSFDEIAGLSILPALGGVFQEAVDSVAMLRELSFDSVKSLRRSLGPLREDIAALRISVDSDLPAVVALANAPGVDPDLRLLTQSHVGDVTRYLRSSDEALAAMVDVIRRQDAAVTVAIDDIAARGMAFGAGVVGVALLAAAVLSLLSAAGIARGLSAIGRTASRMGEGDFRVRVGLKRRDEIGVLGSDLDRILEALGASLGSVQEAAERNRVVRDELMAVCAEAGSSAEEVRVNGSAIAGRMAAVDRLAAETARGLAGLEAAFAAFRGRIGEQARLSGESAAAVAGLLESMEAIEGIAAGDRAAAAELVRESDAGRAVLDGAFDKISGIAGSVGAIEDMAAVIAGIASQTNILAMNAAIEAAHAGEYGKGFAVVADEIAKLAAASAASSEEIARTIAGVVGLIHEAAATRETSGRTFEAIDRRIRGVSASADAVYGHVGGMREGGRRIGQAMEGLDSTAAALLAESTRVEGVAAEVRRAMDDLGRVSHEVATNSGEIAAGIRVVGEGIRRVADHADIMGGIAADLSAAVGAFRTAGGPD